MDKSILFLVSGSFKKSDTPEKSEKVYVVARDIHEALEKAKPYFEKNGGVIFDIESKQKEIIL